MKKNNKRLIIVLCFVGYGMIWLTIAANFNIFRYDDGTLTFLGHIGYYSIILSRLIVSGIFERYFKLNGIGLTLMFIFQFLIYAFIGWIIARLVYPNKKLLPESTEPDK